MSKKTLKTLDTTQASIVDAIAEKRQPEAVVEAEFDKYKGAGDNIPNLLRCILRELVTIRLRG
jgi:hypothetical protein